MGHVINGKYVMEERENLLVALLGFIRVGFTLSIDFFFTPFLLLIIFLKIIIDGQFIRESKGREGHSFTAKSGPYDAPITL